MSNWKIYRPAGRTNYTLNPQARFDLTGFIYTVAGGSTAQVLIDDAYSWRGPTSLYARPTSGSPPVWVEITNRYTNVPPPAPALNETTIFSVYMMGDPQDVILRIYDDTFNVVRAANTVNITGPGQDAWARYSVQWTNTVQNGIDVRFQVYIEGVGNEVWMDGFLLETGAGISLSSYFDGESDGCRWLARAHESFSERSANVRTAGEVLDLRDDLYFAVDAIIDAGAPPITNYMHRYAIKPGGEITNTKIHERPFSLGGMIKPPAGQSANIHDMRRSLTDELMPWAYPKRNGRYQPFRLIHERDGEERYVDVHYEPPSLSGNLDNLAIYSNIERVTLNLLAPDPFWHLNKDDASPDAEARALFDAYYVLNRAPNGAWSNLQTSTNTFGDFGVRAIAHNPVDGKVYIVGEFDDYNGISGANNVVRWNPQTETYETVGAASAVNASISDLVVRSNGDVYVCGLFTGLGGGSGGDYLGFYDLSADQWVGLPAASSTFTAMNVVELSNNDNLLYFGGDYTGWDGDGAQDYIAQYNIGQGTYEPLDIATQLNDAVTEIFAASDGYLYVTGDFTAPGPGIARILQYTGFWEDIAPSPTFGWTGCKGIDEGPDGWIYFSSAFTDGADGITRYNGGNWEQIARLVGTVWDMKFAPDGVLYFVGTSGVRFNEDQNVDVWKLERGSISAVDAECVIERVNAMAIWGQDPVLENQYNITLGIRSAGSPRQCLTGNHFVVTNRGNAITYPTFEFALHNQQPGRLRMIRNTRTGESVDFDLDLVRDDRITLTFSREGLQIGGQGQPSPDNVISGARADTITLVPGDNDIVVFVSGNTQTDVTVEMYWQPAYSGID